MLTEFISCTQLSQFLHRGGKALTEAMVGTQVVVVNVVLWPQAAHADAGETGQQVR